MKMGLMISDIHMARPRLELGVSVDHCHLKVYRPLIDETIEAKLH